MASIVLNRVSTWAHSLRSYDVILDGQKIGTIDNGQTWKLECSPGPHTLALKVDWSKTPEIRILLPAGRDVVFECQSNIYGTSLPLLFRMIFRPHISLRKLPAIPGEK